MDVIVNCTAEFSDNNISTATGVDDVQLHTKVSMPRTKAADETNENDVEG